jgi:hypothetical protein
MVGVTGVEPVTLRLSSACSNQLSYTPIPVEERRIKIGERLILHLVFATLHGRELVELRRFELLTYSLQSYRSTN